MEFDGRSVLLGAGLFGMVIGATLGIVAGAAYRDCLDAFFGEELGVCEDYGTMRVAAFGLVALCGAVAAWPLASAFRERGGFRVSWRR